MKFAACRLMAVFLVGVSGFVDVSAQTATVKTPVYDVVSIKLNNSGSESNSTRSDFQHFSTENSSLKKLLERAYGVKANLISGVPGPIDSARFDVMAKILEPDQAAYDKLTIDQMRTMLRQFIEERFQLKAHVEMKTLPVFDLVVLRGGIKFKPTPGGDAHGTSMNSSRHETDIELVARDMPMDALARNLAGTVQRTVIDKTGLAGSYDLNLKWSTEDSPDTETNKAPGIFTALQEQLGLKLVSTKGPVETLVVDSVKMPSEN